MNYIIEKDWFNKIYDPQYKILDINQLDFIHLFNKYFCLFFCKLNLNKTKDLMLDDDHKAYLTINKKFNGNNNFNNIIDFLQYFKLDKYIVRTTKTNKYIFEINNIDLINFINFIKYI